MRKALRCTTVRRLKPYLSARSISCKYQADKPDSYKLSGLCYVIKSCLRPYLLNKTLELLKTDVVAEQTRHQARANSALGDSIKASSQYDVDDLIIGVLTAGF